MTTKQAIKYFKLILEQKIVEREDVEPLRVLINEVENSVSKDVIREKIKEIEEIPDQMVKEYGIPEESKNIFLNEKGIQVLKELLGE